jgi:hypothetical protein
VGEGIEVLGDGGGGGGGGPFVCFGSWCFTGIERSQERGGSVQWS